MTNSFGGWNWHPFACSFEKPRSRNWCLKYGWRRSPWYHSRQSSSLSAYTLPCAVTCPFGMAECASSRPKAFQSTCWAWSNRISLQAIAITSHWMAKHPSASCQDWNSACSSLFLRCWSWNQRRHQLVGSCQTIFACHLIRQTCSTFLLYHKSTYCLELWAFPVRKCCAAIGPEIWRCALRRRA